MKVEVYLGPTTGRQLVTATLLSVNSKTIIVRLPGGRAVKRKIKRDVPGWQEGYGGGAMREARRVAS